VTIYSVICRITLFYCNVIRIFVILDKYKFIIIVGVVIISVSKLHVVCCNYYDSVAVK